MLMKTVKLEMRLAQARVNAQNCILGQILFKECMICFLSIYFNIQTK